MMFFLRCQEKEDASKEFKELHNGLAGGHLSRDTTTHKILRAGYYWPNLFKYAHAYKRKCDVCQRSGGILSKAAGPLQPVIISEPFEQWGIEIIGEINQNSSLKNWYILTAIDDFTQWVEAVLLHRLNDDAVINFL